MNFDLLKSMLRRHEGYRDRPYKCSAGKITIGVGHNLDDKGLPVEMLERLFDDDIQDSIEACKKIFKTWEKIPGNKQAVLANMAFNLGETRLRGFKNMIIAVEWGDWAKAAVEMKDSKWCSQVGRRCTELSNIMEVPE